MGQLVEQQWEQVGLGECQTEGCSLEQDPGAGYMRVRCFVEVQLSKVELGVLHNLNLDLGSWSFGVEGHRLVVEAGHNLTEDFVEELVAHNLKVSFVAESLGPIGVVPEVPRNSITHLGLEESMSPALD